MATASRGRCDTLGHGHWRKRTQLAKYPSTQRPRVALLGGQRARRRMRGQAYFTLRERAVMGVSRLQSSRRRACVPVCAEGGPDRFDFGQ